MWSPFSEMASPNWATSEQLKFLHNYIPIFIDYTAKEKQLKFWACLGEDWFSLWPELNTLIKDHKLPPQATISNSDMPEDPDTAIPRYQLTEEECELYRAAIQICKQVNLP